MKASTLLKINENISTELLIIKYYFYLVCNP